MRDGIRIVGIANRLTKARARSSGAAVERPSVLRDRAGLSRDERLEVRNVVDRQKIVLTDRLVNRTVRIGDRKRNVARTGKRPNLQMTEFFGRRTETELAGKRNRAAADVEHIERIDNRILERDVKRRGAAEIEVRVGQVRSVVEARRTGASAHGHLDAVFKAERARKAGSFRISPVSAETELLIGSAAHNEVARAGEYIVDNNAAAFLREGKRCVSAERDSASRTEDVVDTDVARAADGSGRAAGERPVAQIARVVGVNSDPAAAQLNVRAIGTGNRLRETAAQCVVDDKSRVGAESNRPGVADAERIVERQLMTVRERDVGCKARVFALDFGTLVFVGGTAERNGSGTRDAARIADNDRSERLRLTIEVHLTARNIEQLGFAECTTLRKRYRARRDVRRTGIGIGIFVGRTRTDRDVAAVEGDCTGMLNAVVVHVVGHECVKGGVDPLCICRTKDETLARFIGELDSCDPIRHADSAVIRVAVIALTKNNVAGPSHIGNVHIVLNDFRRGEIR